MIGVSTSSFGMVSFTLHASSVTRYGSVEGGGFLINTSGEVGIVVLFSFPKHGSMIFTASFRSNHMSRKACLCAFMRRGLQPKNSLIGLMFIGGCLIVDLFRFC